MMGRLNRNAKGNGDVSVDPGYLTARGWSSKATARAAIDELIAAGLLVITRQGGRNRCSLYAVTLWPLDCDQSKLDYGPGAFTSRDWANGPSAGTPPTKDAPAVWTRPRKTDPPTPVAGVTLRTLPPQRGNEGGSGSAVAPAAGAVVPKMSEVAVPPRGSFLELPSVATADTLIGRLLRCRVAGWQSPSPPPGYVTARASLPIKEPKKSAHVA